MKRKSLLFNCLWGVAILTLCGIATMQTRSVRASEDNLITVLNPAVTEKLAERVPLVAPRLDTLEGKTIYLVDMNYEGFGPTPVFDEMQSWFARNMPGVKTIYKLKSGNYVADDPALWREISENGGDGVIMGVAG
jgi:hypothetical protein